MSAIFVGGLQRSGTTLVGRLLAAHPDVTGLVNTPTREDEGQFVQDVYLSDHTMGTVGRKKRRRTFSWAYHAEAHLTEADLARRPDAADRLLAAWRPYFEKPAALAFVEKSPSNVTRMRFLQEAFPGATFVVVTRNPVVQALATRKWLPRSMQVGIGLDEVVAHWVRVMEILEEDAPHIRRLKVVRYEHLLARPESVMNEIWETLELPPVALDAAAIRDENAKYLSYWSHMNEGVRSFGKIEPLNPAARPWSVVPRSLERVVVPFAGKRTAVSIRKFSDRIEHFGYSLDNLESASIWPNR